MKKYYIQDTSSNKYVRRNFDKTLLLGKKELADLFPESELDKTIKECKKFFSLKRDFKPILVYEPKGVQQKIEDDKVTIFEKDNFSWKTLVTILSEIEKDNVLFANNEKEKLSYCDKAILDLLHYLEFDNLTDDKKGKILDLLIKYRKERRKHKVNLNMLHFYNTLNLKAMEDEIEFRENIVYESKVLNFDEI